MKSSAKSHGSAGSAVPRFRPSETLADVIADSELTFPPTVPLPPGKPSFLVLSLSHPAVCCVAPATCSMKHDLPHSGLSLSMSSAPLTISYPVSQPRSAAVSLLNTSCLSPVGGFGFCWGFRADSCSCCLSPAREATLRLVGKHHVPSGGPEGRNTLAPPGSARPNWAPGRRQSGSSVGFDSRSAVDGDRVGPSPSLEPHA